MILYFERSRFRTTPQYLSAVIKKQVLLFLESHKDCLNCRGVGLPVLLLVASILAFDPPAVFPQNAEPHGLHAAAGLSALNGVGFQGGIMNARDFYIREISVLMDLLPLVDPTQGRGRVAATLGVAVRVFGFERVIGNARYRGYDLDVGFRAGPALSFSPRDTKTSRNSRFSLLIEPFLRYSRRTSKNRLIYLELGTIRPFFRAGLMFALG